MKSFLIPVLIILLQPFSQVKYQLVKNIEISGISITTDALGNCYVKTNRKVFKYDYDGKVINNYSNNNFGEIESIDATNPYKLLVFYQNFGKIIFVDNMLSENSAPINFIGTPYNQVSLTCHSFDNDFWVYEPILNELIKLSLNQNPIQRTGNLSRILLKKLSPNFLLEYNTRVYMNDPKYGILVFDQYGTYLKTIAIKNLNRFQVLEDRIHYLSDGKLVTYFMKTLESDTTDLPVSENLVDIQIQKKRMFLLTKNSLNIYQIL